MKLMKFIPRLTSLKIGRRLTLGFSVLTALLIAVVAVMQYRTVQIEELSADAFGDSVVKARQVSDMTTAALRMSRAVGNAQRAASLLPDDTRPQAAARANVKSMLEKYDAALVALTELDDTEEGQRRLKEANAAKIAVNSLLDRVLTLLEQKNAGEALKVLYEEANPAADKWTKLLADYADYLDRKAADDQAAVVVAATRGTRLALGLSGLALLLTVWFSFAISRSITRPLHALQRSIQIVRGGGNLGSLASIDTRDEMADIGFAVNQLLQDQISAREKADKDREKAEADRQKAEAENVALNNSVISILHAVNQLSQRDLTVKAPVTKDVIGTVSDSINALTDETSKVLRGVRDFAGEVEQASRKVKSQADLVSKTADNERKSVTLMIESLAETTQTMNRMAELVQQSDRAAEQATEETDGALETVNGTVQGMESIRATIAETEKRIKRLGERSQEISSIVGLINTISERTHVLALNAAMQAAVAGEAGRGFAVVAEEVQRLAESSRNATQQIAALVSNIQLETNETINTVSRTIGQVVQGSEQAQKAGDQMRRTQAITSELVAQVRRIASSSEEQKTTSAQLLRSVKEIGASTERTAQQILTQTGEADSLLLSARQLVESVSVFKLPMPA